MRKLDNKAAKIFRLIVEDMEGTRRNYKKLKNSKAFMPLTVERVGSYDVGNVYSFCHYFEQNGDLCQDPEMCFIVNPLGVFPCMFQQAAPPVYQESIFLEGAEWKCRRKLQSDHTNFANQWLRNIAEQQNLI